MIGLAYDRSVLSYIYPDNIPPYLVSDNGFKDRDEIDFYFCGHHSPVLAQNLIPMETARGAVRTFVEHRALALDVRWREV
jgi:hypothetical protein